MEHINLFHRLAIPRDCEAVYDLYMDESSNPYLTYDPMGKAEFKMIYNDLVFTNTLFVVETGGCVIASYRLISKKDRQAHIVYLGGFVVSHAWKGKGIGSRILNHIKDAVMQQGKTRLELTVDVENEAAINLYRKVGFQVEGYIRQSYKRNTTGMFYDEYLMGLIL